MSIPIYQVDAFTDTAYKGNPAGVCLLNVRADETWMQNVAAEMNLPETAFLVPQSGDHYEIRWLTPTSEVDLCGHATLASAHLLYEIGAADRDAPIFFSSRSGELVARFVEGWIELDFPAAPAETVTNPPAELIAGIPAAGKYFGKNAFDYVMEVESESIVRGIVPNLIELKKLGVRGIIVTSIADPGKDYDFVSRGFFPGVGIDEDPVTGSAHCLLGPYWMPKLGKSEMTGYQASKRGGYVKLRVEGERVKLIGKGVTVIEGSLRY